jgi:hypothetical protein
MKITTYEGFKKYYETLKLTAREVFDRDKNHSNLFFFITSAGEVIATSFDVLVRTILDNHRCSEDGAKEIAFRAYADLIRDQKCIGFINICEAWAMLPNDSGVDAALREWQYVKEKYGAIRNMPSRKEVLSLYARFLNRYYETLWCIRRIGESVMLSHEYDVDKEIIQEDQESFKRSRMGLLHRAIDAVVERAG